MVMAGMVKVTRPANPGGITPATGPAGAGSRGPRGPDPAWPGEPPSRAWPVSPSPAWPVPRGASGLLLSGRESVPSKMSR